jgi:acetyl esterase/lipase
MRYGIILIFLNVYFCPLKAQEFLKIWPDGKMPNSKGMKLEEVITRQRIIQVDTPGVYVYLTSAEENSGSAVLILPSGGYQKLTYILGGIQIAKWFNILGINAFVLKYRLPNSPDLIEREKGPLQDAQRAMRFIRANALKYKIDPEKIGVMGSSSRGHLATLLVTHNEDISAIGDSLDSQSFHAAFMILVSPVITMGKYTHQGSRNNLLGENPSEDLIKEYSTDLQVNENTPPAFIVVAEDDHAVNLRNNLMFYQAMLEKNIPASLHIFPHGDHAIGVHNNSGSTELWTELCELWLKEMGFLKSN